MLNGQQLQGPQTAEEVNFMLKNKGIEDKYFRHLNFILWKEELITWFKFQISLVHGYSPNLLGRDSPRAND